MAPCTRRERLAGTAPSGAGEGCGGNSGCCSSSDEDSKAFEGWQQLLVAGPSWSADPGTAGKSPSLTRDERVGPSPARTCQRSWPEPGQVLASPG